LAFLDDFAESDLHPDPHFDEHFEEHLDEHSDFSAQQEQPCPLVAQPTPKIPTMNKERINDFIRISLDHILKR
jgi:hypothetical protein